jgi:hypothetical protein
VSKVHSTAAAAYTSTRRSIARAVSCSGGMNASFPLICPSRVTCDRPTAFATPKSTSCAIPSMLTMTLSGDTSRWTISSGTPSSSTSCAACNPARMSRISAPTIPSGMVSPARTDAPMSSDSAAPWTYSMTRNSSASEATTSMTDVTFG